MVTVDVSGVLARLDEIDARTDAATSGPWHVVTDSGDREYEENPPFPYAIAMPARPKVGALEWADQYRDGKLLHYDFERSEVSEMHDEDAEFIAAARSDVPWLSERLRDALTRLQAANERAEKAERKVRAAELAQVFIDDLPQLRGEPK